MEELNTIMDAPIPGQSLTTEVGSRPWQQPAKYSTVEEALEHYAKTITDPAINEPLLDTLEMGTPVTSIAEIVVQSGAMEGLHTIDVSILMLPVIMELIAYVADEAEIEYDMGLAKSVNTDDISPSNIELAMKSLKDKMPQDEEEQMPIPEVQPEESTSPTGLMARPNRDVDTTQGEM
tara:strand:+ start:315 stop:848 length:534 start_codon:yes stop_codon:yes gene_type:complete